MMIPGILAPRFQARFKEWAEDKRGLAAVEFALIAIPFFFLIFGLLEVCVIFIMSSILEHGVGEAAREIRTGQHQAAGTDLAAFRDDVCDETFNMLFECKTNLKLDVKTFGNFASTTANNVIDPATGNLDDSAFGYNPGGESDIVVVRVFYEWNLIIPVLSKPLANMSGDRRLLQATVAFRNEPFGG